MLNFQVWTPLKLDRAGAEQALLGCMRNAQRSYGGSVSPTIHVLVHLLGNLLSMTKVCCGDGDSAGGGGRAQALKIAQHFS